jgi:hypothetical protein
MILPPQSTIQINPQHACALTILVTSGLEMSWTTNAFKFSVERKRGKCLSPSWNHISTSGIEQAEYLTPKERRERERDRKKKKGITLRKVDSFCANLEIECSSRQAK